MANEEIFSEKSNNYQDIAKIELYYFNFERILPGVQIIYQRHINSLINIFKSEEYLRHNPDNFIKVLINNHILQQYLQYQNLYNNYLLLAEESIFLNLPEDVKLLVIYSKHHLLTTECFLLNK